ncbi:two-component system sensor histidine kinase NtrB [Desulforamulus ferrireducens]|nr:ATP-binding protein [Desulforamulus ferrireducens]
MINVNKSVQELIIENNQLRMEVNKLKSLLAMYWDNAQLSDSVTEYISHNIDQALRLSEEMFYKAFDNSPNIMIISTIDAKRILKVNKSFVRITGFSSQDAIVNNPLLLNIISQEQLEIIRKKLKAQEEIQNLETNFLTKNGEVRVGLLSIDTIELNGQSHLLLNMNDITDKINLEKEMARLERLNLIGEMAAGISHEIRNPLTTVRGFLQLFKIRNECLHQQEYFDLMIDELDRANSIITEFLSLAKKKATNKRLTNLNNIIQNLAPLMQADAVSAGKSIRLELTPIPDLLVDEKEIRQIILNLTRNGLEAMGQGGHLTIKTLRQEDEVLLSVQDQGSGISPEIIDKIGTPFFTTKDNGTGLGLAICYSIATRHGARIEIDSSPAGTVFAVHFPLA